MRIFPVYKNTTDNKSKYEYHQIVECSYRQSELVNNKFITAHQLGKRQFYIFDNLKEYLKYIKSLPENKRLFHEYLIKNKPRKLFLDIDDETSKSLKEHNDKINYIIQLIIGIFNSSLYVRRYNFNILRKQDFLLVTSHKYDNDNCTECKTNIIKYSTNIILDNYYFQNHDEMKNILQLLKIQLENKTEIKDIIDWNFIL